MQVSGFRIYFLEPGYFFSKILSEFRKKIVALQQLYDFEKFCRRMKQNRIKSKYLRNVDFTKLLITDCRI